jgi:hypothetical protein
MRAGVVDEVRVIGVVVPRATRRDVVVVVTPRSMDSCVRRRRRDDGDGYRRRANANER